MHGQHEIRPECLIHMFHIWPQARSSTRTQLRWNDHLKNPMKSWNIHGARHENRCPIYRAKKLLIKSDLTLAQATHWWYACTFLSSRGINSHNFYMLFSCISILFRKKRKFHLMKCSSFLPSAGVNWLQNFSMAFARFFHSHFLELCIPL